MNTPYYFAAFVAILISPASKAHFVWHQRVANKERNEVSSLFTFSELPGAKNAGNNDQSARMLFNKGLQVNYVDVDKSTTTALEPQLNGTFITAKVADVLAESFVLESYCEWGIFFREESGPASLLRYYTSASQADYSTQDSRHMNFRKIQDASTNRLRADLHLAHQSGKCSGQGGGAGQSVCVGITVMYDNVPVPLSKITLFHGDSEPKTITAKTDGSAYTSIPRSDERVFVRVNYNLINSPGEINGTAYESISNWATSVMELSSKLEVFPPDSNANKAQSSDNRKLKATIVSISCISAIFAFAVFYKMYLRRNKSDNTREVYGPTMELEKLDSMESC
jgi:hypothetical protein